jgi:hypothetical protein
MHGREELRLARVEVDAHVDRVGVDTLDVSVEDAVEIIEIVVLRADGIVVRRGNSHATSPAIVGTHGGSDVAVVGVDHRPHVAGTNANVDRGVKAVGAVGRALVARDLHHAILASTTPDLWSAAAFLKRNGGEEDGRDLRFLIHLFEDVQVGFAGLEDVSGLFEDGGQVLVDNVLERDWRRHPAVAVDTAVEPVLRAVGSGSRRRVGGSSWITALATSRKNDCASGGARLNSGRRRRGRLGDRLRGSFGRRGLLCGRRVCLLRLWRRGKRHVLGCNGWAGSGRRRIGCDCLVDSDMGVRVVASGEGLSADAPSHPLVAWVDVLVRGGHGGHHQGKNSNNVGKCKLHFNQTSSRVR